MNPQWNPADRAEARAYVERVRPATQPRRFARSSMVEWAFMLTGIALVVAWVLFLAALLVIVSAP